MQLLLLLLLLLKVKKIKQVKQFKYLGYISTSDGKCTTEIKRRIAIAKDSFHKMSQILKNINISMKTMIRVLKSYVCSTLLSRCECWTVAIASKNKLEEAEMCFLGEC